jgi:hypothetical protein
MMGVHPWFCRALQSCVARQKKHIKLDHTRLGIGHGMNPQAGTPIGGLLNKKHIDINPRG